MRDSSIMVKGKEAPFRSRVKEDASAVVPNLGSWINRSVPVTCARSAKREYHKRLHCARKSEATAPVGVCNHVNIAK